MAENDKTLSPAPLKTPLLGVDGLLSQPWALFFQKLAQRVGGTYSDSLTAVTTKLQTMVVSITALQASDATQNTEIAALQTAQTALDGRVGALETELAPASGTWVPAFSGASVSGSVAFHGWWRSIGEELFWECVVDASGGSVTFTSATLDNLPIACVRAGTFAVVNLSNYADYGNGFVSPGAARLPNFSLTGEVAVLSGRYVR